MKKKKKKKPTKKTCVKNKSNIKTLMLFVPDNSELQFF